ncbi:uncharacterized protein LOC101748453 isoform X2 [Gallus gallus]|uniref:uncharacterized protein LOC101748453 isoform X2 n=1 Tax=Gallus gallus TaxID=9031 RepID=UPI001AE1BC5D|nr:uncharacterized protein LOC101748453 isoform X2 [Gallus gallus]XP_046791373.1 uncharacterized protein LOC101748453 isoform X2 [Gallus gallus]
MVDDSFLLVPMTLFFLYVLFLVARVSLLITIWFLQAGRRCLRLRRWWRRGASAPESGAQRPTSGTSCSCSSCNRCSKADQELQQLVLSVLPQHVATPGPEFWVMAWRDLEELVEQGSLSCCSSANDQSEVQRGASASESSAEGQTRGPRCSCSSCNRCSKAEQELQQLVLPALPEHVATLGPEFWDAAWRDLEKLVEQGSLSCCSSPSSSTQLGTVVRESIMQTGAAVRWWEQKEQQPVGLSKRPQEVPHMQKTVRPAAAAPSRLATEDDCCSAASQRLSCAVCGRRRAEQAGRQSVNGWHSWQRVAPTAHRPNCQGSKPGRGAAEQPPQTCTCTCMRPPAHEGLHQPKQGQRCWDNKAQEPSALPVSCRMHCECCKTAGSKRDAQKPEQHSIRNTNRHVQSPPRHAEEEMWGSKADRGAQRQPHGICSCLLPPARGTTVRSIAYGSIEWLCWR